MINENETDSIDPDQLTLLNDITPGCINTLDYTNLEPVAKRLAELLKKDILFSDKTRGEELEETIQSMQAGDIILIQNTRYEDLDGKKESSNDKELVIFRDSFGSSLSPLLVKYYKKITLIDNRYISRDNYKELITIQTKTCNHEISIKKTISSSFYCLICGKYMGENQNEI